MGEPHPPPTGGTVPAPLPRDPPPPPGYDDPLVGSPALDNLVAPDLLEADDETPTKANEQGAHTA